MYEFSPKPEKRTEKLLFAGFLGLAVLLFAGSYWPGIPFPALFQLAGVGCLAFVIIVLSKYLICRYVYRIEEAEDGERELVVVEHCGERVRTVCRIPVGAILSVESFLGSEQSAYVSKNRDKTVFRYTGTMRAERCLGLQISYGGEQFCLCLFYDERLELLLKVF